MKIERSLCSSQSSDQSQEFIFSELKTTPPNTPIYTEQLTPHLIDKESLYCALEKCQQEQSSSDSKKMEENQQFLNALFFNLKA